MIKKLLLTFVLVSSFALLSFGQVGYNPFTQNIHFIPEPTVFGFECGSTQQVDFIAGMTTQDDAVQWQTNPLTITVCIAGFEFNGTNASALVSGSYASNFNWAFIPGSPNCIKGTQNQILKGTGPDPIDPNPLSSGNIRLNLKVPASSPVGTVLSVNVTLQVPTYMALYNSTPDDDESTQTQTFCNCYALVNPGSVGFDQSYCGPADPAAFSVTAIPSGGSGGVIEYQWQELIGSTWTDITSANSATYDAPSLTATKKYRRNTKRSLCGSWLSSNEITVTINPVPTANAGTDKNLNCTTTSSVIGSAAVSGLTYAWSPSLGLSANNIAQPTANPTTTTNYTVTVTNAQGCTASDVVVVNVNTTPPTAGAGTDKSLNCTTTSAVIGTAAISGNTYSWEPITGLSATNIAQPTANPTVTTTYTVTVTGTNGCTATDVVTVTVNTTLPTANAGTDKNLNCTTTSTTIGTTAISGNTYSWSPSLGLSSTSIAQPVASPSVTTSYTVTVTGSNGCTASDVVVVNVNTTPPAADAGTDKNLNCTTTSATIGTAAVSGNSYNWAPSTGLSATNIAQPVANPTSTTSYTVTVTGSNGCTSTDVVNVNVNTTLPTVNAGTDKNLSCVVTSATIGTTAISGNSYSWAPATGLSATNIAQPVANPTSTTTYTITVTGSNGCTATDVVTVNVNTNPPSADAGPDKLLNCTNTSATIGTAGSSGNTYSWSPATGLNSTIVAQPIASPSVTTTYTVTVTGSNGCTATDAVLVTVNTTPPTVDAGPDKTLNCTTTSTLIGTTAISGNTYSWNPTTALSSSSIAQPTASPSTTTTYTVTVTGSNGCVATDIVIVNVNTTTPVVDAGTDKNLNCTITSAVIGTAAVSGNTYSWSPVTGLSSTTIAQPTASPTTTTTYTVTVTGANGCTATDAVIVNVNNTPPAVDAGPNKNLYCTTTSATIGTTGVIGATYSWSPATGLNSATTAQPSASPTSTTTYTVTVTGANGCTATDVVTVNVNTTPPVTDAGPDKNLNCSVTSSTIGTSPISGNTYSWSPNTGLNSVSIAQPTASPLVTTTYTVTVTGANGCTATDAVVVNVNTTLPTVDAGPDKNLNCTTTSTTIGTSSIVGNTYAWAPATGLSATNIAQPTANPTVTTSYTVTVTGSNGCVATDVVLVAVNTTPPSANAGPDKTLTCATTSTVIGTFPVSGNLYSWSPATNLSSTTVAQPAANPSVTTTYTVTVTGTNGCTATDVVIVNVDTTPPTVDAGLDKNLTCTTTSTTIGTSLITGYNYSWLPSTGLNSTIFAQPTANPTTTTTYTVTVTGTNGCTATDVVTVNVNTVPPVANAGPDKDVCSLNSVMIGSPEIIGNTYDWSPATNLSATNIAQPIANPSTTTTYTVTVTGANGCTSTDAVTVFFKEGSIGNYVWADNNGDGINNESASAGINGVTVELWKSSDNVIGNADDVLDGTTLTANNGGNPGYYNFIICNTSYYYVKFPTTTTTGNHLTVQTTTAATDNNSDANVTTGISPIFQIDVAGSGVSKNNPTIDAGYFTPLSVGNFIWNDINKNGIVDQNETGISGATVHIYVDANSDGSPDGPAIQTTNSNTNGLYAFNNLAPGNYVIGVVPPVPSSGPAFTSSPVNETNANLDGDNNDNGISTLSGQTFSGTISLGIGTEPTLELPNNTTVPDANSNLTIDFGFYQAINIAGNVFIDNNGPTNVDGTPTNSAGTPLYANLVDVNGNVIASVPVNPNGTYQFNDVQPNTNYCMVLSTTLGTVGAQAPSTTLPNGWVNVSEDCCDNTGNDLTTNGITCFAVANETVTNVNFGITELLSLGNLVFDDANKNGVKDNNEVGISNAVVKLYEDANGDCVADGAAIQTTNTNSNGLYIFDNLTSGKYIVGVTPPSLSNGSYVSSVTGEETNPDLNIDDNDNGTVSAGLETRSCTITLLSGTEPLGELPNNAAVVDANANLTVDFAFFQCPNNFTFTPVEVCAGTTIDLTTLEPAGYTGGVWTNNGNVVTNTLVANGTYVYTFSNGSCIATGTQTVGIQVPDYAPIIAITPSVVYGVKPVRVVVTVNELLNRNSCKPVYVFIPRLEPRYTFTWNPTATQLGSGPAGAVLNAEWQYFTSNPNFYIWKYIANGSTFPASGQSKFGYVGVYDPNNTDGSTTFSVQIFQGSGGETNLLNNTDSEILLYYRQ